MILTNFFFMMLLMNVIIFYTELDLVLLPPDNVDGDTDKEVGNGTELTDINFDQIVKSK